VQIRIDLNADVGESFGRWTLGDDAAVLACVTSANIACGYHAGDPVVMRRTVRLARDAGVAVGAHPSLPDLAGFGRREMRISADDLEDLVLYQAGALAAIAAAEGVRLQHVKPHGALYTMAARDPALADAFVRAVAALDPSLLVFAPPGSQLVRAAAAAGLRTAPEGFADRAYDPDGSLAPRSSAGAIVEDPDLVVARSLRMVQQGVVRATDGSDIPLRITTLCTHGDTPGSAGILRALRAALEAAGIEVGAPGATRSR